jgi:DNA-directed RNA polymerase II subunit RPB2
MDPDEFEYLTFEGTLNAFFRDQPGVLIAHQIDSYNDAIETVIPSIIASKENNPLVIKADFRKDGNNLSQHTKEYELHWGKVSVGRPVVQENTGVTRPLTPQEARIKNITYQLNVYVDVMHRLRYRDDSGNFGEWDTEEVPRVLLCRIPLMLGSKFCILGDVGPSTRAELGECKCASSYSLNTEAVLASISGSL